MTTPDGNSEKLKSDPNIERDNDDFWIRPLAGSCALGIMAIGGVVGYRGQMRDVSEWATGEKEQRGLNAMPNAKTHPFMKTASRSSIVSPEFSTVQFARRTLGIATSLVGLATTLVGLGTIFIFDLKSPQEACQRLKIWAPKQRMRLMDWLHIPYEPVSTSGNKDGVPSLSPEQEWAQWMKEAEKHEDGKND